MKLNNQTSVPVLLIRSAVRNGDQIKLRDGMCGHFKDIYPLFPLSSIFCPLLIAHSSFSSLSCRYPILEGQFFVISFIKRFPKRQCLCMCVCVCVCVCVRVWEYFYLYRKNIYIYFKISYLFTFSLFFKW